MSTHQSIEICCLICVFIKSHWTDKATITYLSSDFCCHLSRFLTAKILYCNSMLILSPVLSIICVPSSLEHHSPLYPGAFATVQHILNICKNSGWVCAGCQVSYHTLFFFFCASCWVVHWNCLSCCYASTLCPWHDMFYIVTPLSNQRMSFPIPFSNYSQGLVIRFSLA